jgi:IclR family acetate operon transcriptional repressor
MPSSGPPVPAAADQVGAATRPATPAAARSALGKTVAVVETLAQTGRLSDIARQTRLPVSTVHRILQELVAAGWAREEENRTYSLGARLLSLPARSTGSPDPARLARPVLRELASQTGRTVHFALRDGEQLVYVDKIEGRGAYAMRSRIGGSIPLHSTSIGKSVLARMDDAEVRQIAATTGLPKQTSRTLSDITALLRHLGKVRSRGFAVDDEEQEVHTRCVGAAVLDHRGEPVGGVSVSSLVFDLSLVQVLEVAPLVVAAAERISRAMGDPRPAGPVQPVGPAGKPVGR